LEARIIPEPIGAKQKGSELTIDTGSWFALKLGGAAPGANSIRGSYLSPAERGDRREEIFHEKGSSKPCSAMIVSRKSKLIRSNHSAS
jgi:hypothetical protein